MRMRGESKPSSVLDDHLSRSCDRPDLAVTGCSRLPTSASNLKRSSRRLLRGGLPFSPARRRSGLCCSHPPEGGRRSGLSTLLPTPPWLNTRHPALCSSDFPLARRADQRPSIPASLGKEPPAVARGRCDMVPKGRLELPWANAHYALNVARLPVPPLRLSLVS